MGSTENSGKIVNISNIGEIRTNFEFIEIENEGRENKFARIWKICFILAPVCQAKVLMTDERH